MNGVFLNLILILIWALLDIEHEAVHIFYAHEVTIVILKIKCTML